MSDNFRKGFFITFEGTDGVGKTTQVKLLAGRIRSTLAMPVHQIREPGGSPVCEDIRTILKSNRDLAPICELMLFNAARNQLIYDIIQPALNQNHVVICDRFLDSTYAYQQFGNGLLPGAVTAAVAMAVGDTMPNLTILLELDEAEATARASTVEESRDGIAKYDAASVEFKKRVTEGFKQRAKSDPWRIKTISALGTVEEVHDRIWNLVFPLLQSAHLPFRG